MRKHLERVRVGAVVARALFPACRNPPAARVVKQRSLDRPTAAATGHDTMELRANDAEIGRLLDALRAAGLDKTPT